MSAFVYKSFMKEIERDLAKGERRVIRKAASKVKSKIRSNIKALGLVDKGDLLKGVKDDIYQHTMLIGMAPPAFDALMVEIGSYKSGERISKSGKSSGIMPATPFLLPAFRSTVGDVQNILSENWL